MSKSLPRKKNYEILMVTLQANEISNIKLDIKLANELLMVTLLLRTKKRVVLQKLTLKLNW